MFARRFVLTAALLVALSGCASVPIGSLVQLSRTDVMTTDLAELRAALWLPSELRPLPDTARLAVIVRREGQPDETLDLALIASDNPADIAAFPPSSGHYLVYRLGADDRARLDAVRSAIQADRRPGSMTFAVGIREFCRTGAIPSGPLYASSYIRTSEIGAFVPLIERFDLRSDPQLAAAFDAVAPC